MSSERETNPTRALPSRCEGLEGDAAVAGEAVQLVNHDHIEAARFGVGKQVGERRGAWRASSVRALRPSSR